MYVGFALVIDAFLACDGSEASPPERRSSLRPVLKEKKYRTTSEREVRTFDFKIDAFPIYSNKNTDNRSNREGPRMAPRGEQGGMAGVDRGGFTTTVGQISCPWVSGSPFRIPRYGHSSPRCSSRIDGVRRQWRSQREKNPRVGSSCARLVRAGKFRGNSDCEDPDKAAEPGFEPRLSDSESLVLPLHHSALLQSCIVPLTHSNVERCTAISTAFL